MIRIRKTAEAAPELAKISDWISIGKTVSKLDKTTNEPSNLVL